MGQRPLLWPIVFVLLNLSHSEIRLSREDKICVLQ